MAALQPLLPAHALLWHAEDTVPYECDGLTLYRQLPMVVALPEDMLTSLSDVAPLAAPLRISEPAPEAAALAAEEDAQLQAQAATEDAEQQEDADGGEDVERDQQQPMHARELLFLDR